MASRMEPEARKQVENGAVDLRCWNRDHAIYRAWPAWQFMANSSLVEDEIANIATYTSRGFIPAVSTYKLARNHVFYNVLSTALPGAASTVPLRARLVSFFPSLPRWRCSLSTPRIAGGCWLDSHAPASSRAISQHWKLSLKRGATDSSSSAPC